MSTDRELIELAAKAAGIEDGADRIDSGLSLTEKDGRHRSLPRWNPLEDDGDALRLAYKLRLVIAPLRTLVGEDYGFAVHPHGRDDLAVVESGTDIASMRLAIARAAAEIGRGMK